MWEEPEKEGNDISQVLDKTVSDMRMRKLFASKLWD